MGKQLDQPITLSNRDIRMMLKLAEANKNDVFCDLGCGHGQLCIIAVKEFNVKYSKLPVLSVISNSCPLLSTR